MFHINKKYAFIHDGPSKWILAF